MFSIDLNFLKEDEIESIVSVIEKDFEVKAAENARICKIRKQIINKDHKAELLSQSPFEGSFCVICCTKFFIIFNPKNICASCGMQICQSCCVFIKKSSHIICSICQQQQDLLAMNCSWFYDATSRKFMEGGSQIVANSLSEYPKKNAISPYILNMVKGTQITKFRLHIEDASRTILNSLQKVEAYDYDEKIKADRYNDLIKKFSGNLVMILNSTGQNLYVTLENYNYKTGIGNQNIQLKVFRILHDEVESLVGKKINIKPLLEQIKKSKRDVDVSDLKSDVENQLVKAIVEKLISDYQKFLIETRNIPYDQLNSALKDIVKDEPLELDHVSVSQFPSRQGTVRLAHPELMIPEPVLEVSPCESDDSSKIYNLSGVNERTNEVSKKWNEVKLANTQDTRDEKDNPPEVPVRLKRSSSLSRKSAYDNDMKVDSDVITMTTNNNQSSNWLMNARQPFGSLNSLNNLANDPYSSWNKSKSRPLTQIEPDINYQNTDKPKSRGRPVTQIEPDINYQNTDKPKSRGRPVTQIEPEIKDKPQSRGRPVTQIEPDIKDKPQSRGRPVTQIEPNVKFQNDDKSRIPLSKFQNSGSLNNLDHLLNDPYIALNRNKIKKTPNQRPPSHTNLDDDIDGLVTENKTFTKQLSNMSIDEEYKKNLPVATGIPTLRSEYRSMDGNVSQDSGIVVRMKKSQVPKPSKFPVFHKAKITKPQSVTFKKNNNENGSNSSIDL